MSDSPQSPDDLEWRRKIEARMSDYDAAMVGDFKNPTGMMQNMLRVMNTLYHEKDGVVVKQGKHERILYIGFGVLLAFQYAPTLLTWFQKLLSVKP